MIGGDIIKTKVAKEYLKQLRRRYKKARKSEKTIILDELTKTAGYTRKHAIHLLCGTYKHKWGMIQRPRKMIYTVRDAAILEKIADLLSWINSKRLQPAIPVALDQLSCQGELLITEEDKKRLVSISSATIDRLLTRYHR